MRKKDSQPAVPEIEASVLGSIIIDQDAMFSAAEMLRAEHLFVPAHQKIYKAMLELFAENIPVDSVTLYDKLKKNNQLEECGGAVYLSKLSQNVSSSANIVHHCKIILDRWIYRKQIEIYREAANKAMNQEEDCFDLLSKTIHKLENDILNSLHKTVDEQNFYNRLPLLMQKFEDERNQKIESTLKCTEFPSFNLATGGLKAGNLIVISGKYKAGKTRFSLSLLRDFAVNKKIPVGLVGFEMDQEEYDKNLLSMQTGTRYQYLRDPSLKNKDGSYQFTPEAIYIMKLRAEEAFFDTNFFITDSVSYDVELFAKMRYWNHKHGVKVVCVDYLQLVQVSKDYERRDLEISYLSRMLKNISRQLGLITIIIVQENEKGESAESKGPLKDSDFWFSVTHPIDEGKKTIKIDDKEVNVDQSLFKILFKASRHSPNGGSFLTKFFENGEYKEFSPEVYPQYEGNVI